MDFSTSRRITAAILRRRSAARDAVPAGVVHLRLAVPDLGKPHDRAGAEPAGRNVSFVEFPTDKGHDAFLLDEPEFHRALAGFLRGCAAHAGLRI